MRINRSKWGRLFRRSAPLQFLSLIPFYPASPGTDNTNWPSVIVDKFQFSRIFFFLNIYLFIFGCVGSSFLCEGFLPLWQAGATLHRGARASHYRGLSCCGAQAPDAQAQQLWLTGPVTPRHVGSSQTRAWTRVPCIGRQTLNHCATREAPQFSRILYKSNHKWYNHLLPDFFTQHNCSKILSCCSTVFHSVLNWWVVFYYKNMPWFVYSLTFW